MSSTRKNHPANCKSTVALSALREDAPISELAVKYGGHATVIHRWKREARSPWMRGFLESVKNPHRSRAPHP